MQSVKRAMDRRSKQKMTHIPDVKKNTDLEDKRFLSPNGIGGPSDMLLSHSSRNTSVRVSMVENNGKGSVAQSKISSQEFATGTLKQNLKADESPRIDTIEEEKSYQILDTKKNNNDVPEIVVD